MSVKDKIWLSDQPMATDYTIPQNWQRYTQREHARWDRLVERQKTLLAGRACAAFLNAQERLSLSKAGIPHFGRLSDRLDSLTGWQIVAVPHLVPDAIFFEHLANRRFPAGAFIRAEHQMNYIKEPDVFHDVYGHAPLLANPTFAKYMETYGKVGMKAVATGELHYLARLYWYTVEFGLIKGLKGLQIYGAGILSSPAECRFALEDPSPNRLAFNLPRILRTRYRIDDFQQTYFVINNFEQLLEETSKNLTTAFEQTASRSDYNPGEVTARDEILTRGTMQYFTKQALIE